MSVPPSKILVSTDFSEPAGKALDYAIALGKKTGAEIILLHAYELPIVGFPDGAFLATAEMANRIIMSAQDALDSLAASRKAAGVPIATLLKNGDPRDTILAVAKDVAADLIVMGTHGRRGFARLLIGSVTEAIVRIAECPVLTVRASPAESR